MVPNEISKFEELAVVIAIATLLVVPYLTHTAKSFDALAVKPVLKYIPVPASPFVKEAVIIYTSGYSSIVPSMLAKLVLPLTNDGA